jgi:MYXO-CTERM domain-containing protein
MAAGGHGGLGVGGHAGAGQAGSTQASSGSSGCDCAVGNTGGSTGALFLTLMGAALGATGRRRRRRR